MYWPKRTVEGIILCQSAQRASSSGLLSCKSLTHASRQNSRRGATRIRRRRLGLASRITGFMFANSRRILIDDRDEGTLRWRATDQQLGLTPKHRGFDGWPSFSSHSPEKKQEDDDDFAVSLAFSGVSNSLKIPMQCHIMQSLA